MWVIGRDGSGNRLAYQRDAAAREWIVHETWLPRRRELLTTRWPHGVIAVDINSGDVREVTRFPDWHPVVDRQGERMVWDTTFPDRGPQLFDLAADASEPHLLCDSDSSSVGAHWDTDHCPYDDGPVQVYAPQRKPGVGRRRIFLKSPQL